MGRAADNSDGGHLVRPDRVADPREPEDGRRRGKLTPRRIHEHETVPRGQEEVGLLGAVSPEGEFGLRGGGREQPAEFTMHAGFPEHCRVGGVGEILFVADAQECGTQAGVDKVCLRCLRWRFALGRLPRPHERDHSRVDERVEPDRRS